MSCTVEYWAWQGFYRVEEVRASDERSVALLYPDGRLGLRYIEGGNLLMSSLTYSDKVHLEERYQRGAGTRKRLLREWLHQTDPSAALPEMSPLQA